MHQHSSILLDPTTDVEFPGHATHALALAAPTTLLYVLTAHSVHTLAPAFENVPAPQDVHELSEGAPVAAENFPAMHCEQALAPVAAAYLPTPQSVQTISVVAPVADEYFPVPQSVHAAVPVTVLYLPATHPLHGPPSGPVYPMLQIQLVIAGELVGDCELGTGTLQLIHELSSEMPSPGWNVLTPQSVHAVSPGSFPYFPAAHRVQKLAPPPEYFPRAQLPHVEPCNENLPATQSKHMSRLFAPACDDLPAAQERHVIADICAIAPEYFPAVQSVQTWSPLLAPYFPTGQLVQLVAPVVSTKLPVAHSVQNEAPLAENEPPLHSAHAASDVALVAAENLPAPQRLQTDTPAALNRPAPQSTHAVAAVLLTNFPAAHTLHAAAPAADIVPTPQSAHTEAP